MTSDELIAVLVQEMKQLDVDLIEDDYTNAVTSAQRETWALPITDGFKLHWVQERAKRHLFFMLATGRAKDFKVKQYSLSERFRNLRDLCKDMDAAFKAIRDEFPDAFPTLSDSDINDYELFGSYINSGFQYDGSGKDTTYETSNSSVVTPAPESYNE